MIPSDSILLLSVFLLAFTGCKSNTGKIEKNPAVQLNASEVNPASVKFRSFQNPDSTWGYTIFVNSRLYLHYNRIPFNKTGSGFPTRQDAETVAALLTKMIKNGDMTPKLGKKTINSLELNMKMKNQREK